MTDDTGRRPKWWSCRIGMPQSEHQPWRCVTITRNADDHAIDCAAAFDFDPVTLTGRDVSVDLWSGPLSV